MDKSPTNQMKLSQKQLQLHLEQQQQKYYLDNHDAYQQQANYFPSPSSSPPIPHFPPPPEYPPPAHQQFQTSPASNQKTRQSKKKNHHNLPDPNCIEVCIDYHTQHNSMDGLDVAESMKWNRNNIAATMEKYEPAQKHHQPFKHSTMGHSLKYHPQSQQHPNQDYLNDIHQDYAYAYYEPGVPMRHNIPSYYEEAGPSRPPPANSIRALLMTARKNNMQRNGGKIFYSGYESGVSGNASGTSVRNQENVYEEIRGDDKLRKIKSESSSASLEQNLVEEEFREVHNRHQRILDELNLSVEEMLMPTPESMIPKSESASFYPTDGSSPTPSKTEMSPVKQPKDDFCIDLINNQMASYNREFTSISGLDSSSSSCNNTSTSITSNNNIIGADLSGDGSNGGGDLDSGFSGSNSSYIGSLRYHKTMKSATAMKMSPMNRSAYRGAELPPNSVSFLKHDHNAFCCHTHSSPLQISDDFGINSLSLYDSERMRCCGGNPAVIGSCREPTIFMSQFTRSNSNFSPRASPPDTKSSKGSFWKSKTWCKFPGFSKNSTNSKIESNKSN